MNQHDVKAGMALKAPINIDVPQLFDTITHAISIFLMMLLGTLNPQIGYFYLGLLIDIGMGAWVAKKEKNFSWKFLISKSAEKLIIYTLLIVMGHVGDVVGKQEDTIRGAVLIGILIKETPSFLSKLKKLGYKKEAEILGNALPKGKSDGRGDEEQDEQ